MRFQRPRIRRATSSVALTLALVLAAPVAAWADTPGGSTPGAAVPLPISDFDSAFVASNVGISTAPGSLGGGMPVWYNVAWYTVTPSQTTTVYIRATGPWDNTLEVWTGGSLVVQNDDSYGLDAALSTTLYGGTTYLVGLGSYSGASGTATLTFASRVPGAPDAPTATAGSGTAAVSWSPPADLAGGVTGYQVLCTPEGGAETVCGSTNGTPPSTGTTVSGLTNGTSYTVRVQARNVLGWGDPSAPSAAFVPKAPASVSLSASPATPVSGQTFSVTASVTSGGSPATGTVDVTVDGVTTSGVSLVGGQATVTGLSHAAGSVAVSATYSGTAAVSAATGTGSVTVAKRSQSVTLSALPDSPVYDGTPATVSASSSESLAVAVTASGACTLSGDQLSFTGVGVCHVDAVQAGTSEVQAASTALETTVGKRPQTISLAALPAMVYGTAVELEPTSSVGLAVSLAADGACSLDGTTLQADGVGDCTVTASQAGDSVTSAAVAVVRTQSVGKRPQTITLTELPDLIWAAAPVPVTATSEFGLPVTLTAEGACAMVDGSLHVVGVGTCAVTASSEGDDVTEPATAVVTKEIASVPTHVTVDLAADLGQTIGGREVTVRSSGLLPGSDLVLEVHSTPRELGRVVVGADGTATVTGVLPVLEPGEHEIVAVGTSLTGEPVQSTLGVTVARNGTVTRIADEVLTARPADTLASTGTEPRVPAMLALVWVLGGAALLWGRRRLLPARSH